MAKLQRILCFIAVLLPLSFSTVARAADAPSGGEQTRPYKSCSYMVGEAWKQSPLPEFDPANLSRQLPRPAANLDARIVLCLRDHVVPASYDYRVTTEMGLPLFIRAGDRIIEIASDGHRLVFVLTQGTPLSSRENEAVQARMAQMNATSSYLREAGKRSPQGWT